MPIYKPSELRLFLSELGIFPKKGLSQNFLIDGNIIRKIVQAAHVQPGDLVLEIGPGPGSLTQLLLEAGAHVIAVEKDQTLAAALERLQTPSKQLEVFCNDIMTFPIKDVLSQRLKPHTKAKVIANLPYHLTTPILAMLAPYDDLFSSLTVMVQEEVARRFAATPGNKDYGSFTVFLNFYGHPKYAFGVSRNCFYPAPKVDSAVVVVELSQTTDIKDVDGFFQLTRTAFEHRRKMLRASLKGFFSPEAIEKALSSMGRDPLSRPEQLGFSDFVQLYHLLTPLAQK